MSTPTCTMSCTCSTCCLGKSVLVKESRLAHSLLLFWGGGLFIMIPSASLECMVSTLTSYPGLHPDFISQPWRKVDFSPRLRDKVWVEAWVQRLLYTASTTRSTCKSVRDRCRSLLGFETSWSGREEGIQMPRSMLS